MTKRASSTRQRGPATSLEALVDRFVGSLDQSELLRSVDALASVDAARIPALLLRSGLVQPMRDEDRAAKRDVALENLAARVGDEHGSEAGAGIERAARLIALVEHGYRALSDKLDEMLANAPPEDWLWAVLDRAAELVDWSLGEIDRRAAATKIVDGSVFAVPDGAGSEFRIDELMAMVDGTTSLCIKTLAARHGWHDGDGAVVLPDRPADSAHNPEADVEAGSMRHAGLVHVAHDDHVLRHVHGDIGGFIEQAWSIGHATHQKQLPVRHPEAMRRYHAAGCGIEIDSALEHAGEHYHSGENGSARSGNRRGGEVEGRLKQIGHYSVFQGEGARVAGFDVAGSTFSSLRRRRLAGSILPPARLPRLFQIPSVSASRYRRTASRSAKLPLVMSSRADRPPKSGAVLGDLIQRSASSLR